MWFTGSNSRSKRRAAPMVYPYTLRHQMDEGMADLYFSCDCETDGPIPGEYSLLSFALVAVASFDGEAFRALEEFQGFYRELKPISTRFEPEALAVNGLDRTKLIEHGIDPAVAMVEAAEWVRETGRGYRPVFVGYPAVFDWMWMFWYFTHFVDGGSPFGFSACIDLKTMLATKARLPIGMAKRSLLPAHLVPARPHTHNALDDAIEQGEFFVRLFSWERPGA